jgi:hypothetical protein
VNARREVCQYGNTSYRLQSNQWRCRAVRLINLAHHQHVTQFAASSTAGRTPAAFFQRFMHVRLGGS